MPVTLKSIKVGDELPRREHEASNVSLFLYNAAVWNPHRIHYDDVYAREQEGYSALVIDGPLQGDWLCQAVTNWLGGDGELLSFSYSNRLAAYLGETLTSGGRIAGVDPDSGRVELDLYIENETGEVTTPGRATVVLAP
ncbi:MAG: hypothetical protein QF921_08110 [Pseudomonadales bacterium]|jgi:3-methylfumaryl-CoA hydratase|nr:hypothetical protein [Pseudomonadales bacterium]MDP6472448.1 hypothetical protein [Pseudomonadales bacterium]MDP6828741.1 hypothetical protein [Pseudomonadales bacterium]MDP6971462.1 hypothetical protein [Pseudomonadales bacterium]|tara:strand:- start:1928 stop:2344 length:417 start_codon:yes stop_codon:yes gene_type:complete